ncbi:MAG: hypothetical protein WC872_02245 [Candidatus Absconditabacterales bacterium]
MDSKKFALGFKKTIPLIIIIFGGFIVSICLYAKTGILQNNLSEQQLIPGINNTGEILKVVKDISLKENRNYYTIDTNSAVNFWLTRLSIITTIFAVFFVYNGFKIEGTVEKVEEAEKRILKLEKETREDMEYSNQLKYAIQYMMSKQYQKAIDALSMLRAEPSTLKDLYKLNSCLYFLAVCYYEQGCKDNDIGDIAKALEYINEAIVDPAHPLRLEILHKFEGMNMYIK